MTMYKALSRAFLLLSLLFVVSCNKDISTSIVGDWMLANREAQFDGATIPYSSKLYDGIMGIDGQMHVTELIYGDGGWYLLPIYFSKDNTVSFGGLQVFDYKVSDNLVTIFNESENLFTFERQGEFLVCSTLISDECYGYSLPDDSGTILGSDGKFDHVAKAFVYLRKRN